MRKTEEILEFDKIKEKWAQLALTEQARQRIMEQEPCLSETELALRQRETTEARTLLEKEGTPPLVSMEGIGTLLAVASRGDCLTAAQLEQIESALTAVKRLKDYLDRGKALELSLPYYEENLDGLAELRDAIHVQIRNGQVDDYASKLLHGIRADIQRTKERMKEKADGIMKSHKECMSDSYSTFRNGRLCVPVKKEYKFRISGSVIDKSATGSTLFIEPAAVAKHSEELSLLMIDEENEERRILYTLTAQVAESGEAMAQNLRTMEKLDFIFSKGKLSMELHGTRPRINTGRRILLKEACHPLMDRDNCVPQDFRIGDDYRGIVITGPNTGGKTVAIKTVALNCMMAQCGLHVSCREADVCMNSDFLCDIGDGQNLSENLSTFSAHITNVLDILREVGPESLVVMDELGSGTDPAEGMGIAVAIMEELKKSGCLFLVTTHYPEVKEYAAAAEGLINARMTFDRESLQPTYQMVIGEAGESCAFYIAARLGMPEHMLRTAARTAYGAASFAGGAGRPDSGTTGAEKGTGGERRAGAEKGAAGERAARAEKESDRKRISKGLVSEARGEDGGQEPGRGQEEWERHLPKTEQMEHAGQQPEKASRPKIQKKKEPSHRKDLSAKFRLGDSVMLYPDKKIGIVCEPVNEKGVLRVQLPDKKIWINHERVKLHVAAEELYPEGYDFSIVFDTVENRKLRHQMERKFVEEGIVLEE
nr:DNA mismatch repair protein MutS [uncultured Acetatifactor sp.]